MKMKKKSPTMMDSLYNVSTFIFNKKKTHILSLTHSSTSTTNHNRKSQPSISVENLLVHHQCTNLQCILLTYYQLVKLELTALLFRNGNLGASPADVLPRRAPQLCRQRARGRETRVDLASSDMCGRVWLCTYGGDLLPINRRTHL